MVKEAGAPFVIIGHSERRRLFGETDVSRQPQGSRRDRRRAHADRLHRRNARGARSAANVRCARSPDRRRARRISRRRDGPDSRSPTSRCGRSARAGTRPRPKPSAATRTSRTTASGIRRARPRRRAAFSTAARCKPTTSRRSLGLPDVDGALVGGASLEACNFRGHRARARTGLSRAADARAPARGGFASVPHRVVYWVAMLYYLSSGRVHPHLRAPAGGRASPAGQGRRHRGRVWRIRAARRHSARGRARRF